MVEGDKVVPPHPGGGAMRVGAALVYEFDSANEGRLFVGGGARLCDVVVFIGEAKPGERGSVAVLVDMTEKLDKLLLLTGAIRGNVWPVCDGVMTGVPFGIGVDTEEEGKSSHAMTSKALPPMGMSLATWLPLFLPDPTNVAKSTSPLVEP